MCKYPNGQNFGIWGRVRHVLQYLQNLRVGSAMLSQYPYPHLGIWMNLVFRVFEPIFYFPGI